MSIPGTGGAMKWAFPKGRDDVRWATEFFSADLQARIIVFHDEVACYHPVPEGTLISLRSGVGVRVTQSYGEVGRALDMMTPKQVQEVV